MSDGSDPRRGPSVSHAGRLLVATPLIADPTFERSVVLVMAHSAEGAFGVVLNRPSDTLVREVAPEWADAASLPGVVFVGGPVGQDAVIGLGVPLDDHDRASLRLVGGCAPVDLHQPPGSVGESGWAAVRLFAGSAGWTAGQLEDELDEGAWWVIDARMDDVSTSRPERLWSSVLRRQRGEVAWFANHPEDPSAN